MEKIVCITNNKAVTNTRIIAKHFGRSHDELIHALRDVIRDCGAEFSEENFFELEHGNLHWVTYAGFLVISGLFMGTRNARTKIAFIDEFTKAQEEIDNMPRTVHDELLSSRPAWTQIAHYHNADMLGKNVIPHSLTAR